ncbi:MAG TPA: sensor histidine kinase, partial [Bacteroidetes bacterium]|nr:sensor histidine kinase [Bacteroidota bacterium]
VINELVSNALKYAFPNSFRQKKLRPPKIEIALLRLSSGRYELQVSDNGVGLSPELDIQKTSSLGLRLVTILVKDQLGGNLTVDRSNGTAFQIIFNDGVSA